MQLSIWTDPPKMAIGAPQPIVVAEDGVVWVSYRTQRDDHFSVLRFDGVRQLTFGEPSDERLDEHQLWGNGLNCYSFHEGTDPELERAKLRHWVITFHDDTLDVTARAAEVVARAVQATDSASALAMTRA